MERLKQKVIASLQQAAGGTFSGGGGGGGEHAAAPTSPQQSSNPETNAAPAVAAAAAAAAAAASGGAVQLPEAALSTSWLAAADATAHLTEKEREILLCVFKKEEQFKRDLIKEWSSLRAQQQEPGAGDGHCGGVPAAGAGAATSGRQPISRQQSLSAMSSAAAATSSTAAQRATCAAHAHQPPTRFSPASSSGASSAASRPNSSSAGRPQASAGGPAPASGAGSSCASSAPSGNSTPGAAHVGLCRICRKLIGPTEPCHLCSNCQQIICDDCASYSASDQHWMCSSCRRRAMNPAIPAEALKELGLNQNSSALRRMTLRLNQNELKLAINKSSSESNSSSSNSSSGCSSIQPASSIQQRLRHMAPTGNAATAAATATTSTTASQLPGGALGSVAPDPGEPAGKLASGRQLAAAASVSSDKTSQSTVASKQQNKRPVASLPLDSLPSDLSRPKAQQSRSGGQPAAAAPTQPGAMPKIRPQLGTTTSDLAGGSGAALVQFSAAPLIDGGAAQVDSRASGRASYEPAGAQHKLVAQKTMSQPSASGTPTPGVSATPSHQQQAPPTGRAPGGASPGHRRSSIRRGPSATATATAAAAAAPGTTGVPRQLHQQQELARRASAVAMGQAAAGSSLGAASQQRKQSSAAALAQESTSAGPGRYVFDSSQRNSIVAMHQHLIKQRFAQQQPQTLITGPDSRRNSFQQAADYCELGAAADGSAHANNTLIPVPPEQMHLRRLSDQSNLVRRSSIIVDTLTSDNGLAIARNRSHSNTDCSGYIYQAALMQQQQQQQQQQLSSIITSYAHKNRHSSEDLHSDSSSDIADCAADDAPRATQMAPYEQLGPYAAPSDTYQQQQQQRQVFYSQQHQAAGANGQQQQAPGAGQFRMQHQTSVGSSSIQIPSVSVSEFNVAQQQQRRNSNAALSSSVSNGSHQQQQQQQQQVIYSPDQISAIGEINVAIEQVIQQQKQREQQQQLMPSQVANGGARRGSSGRILPKIPGEIQSRSLLDLPLQPAGGHAGDPGAGPASGGAGGPGRASGDGQMLDLPSPTIRRASAPEGQNIKIVVDDIDSHGCYNACNLIKPHNHHLYLQQHQHHPHYLNNCNTNNNNSTSTNNHGNHYNHLNYIHQKALLAGAKGGQVGELLERLVLYRDDSLDPGGNSVSRGFGLQVMGGKLGADGELSAQVAWVLAQGPADKSGLGPGDQLIEWDGKCLLGLSYEQVAEVIESSGNFAELLVKPVQRLGQQPGANYIRSQRRMSQQTETDLRRMQEQQQLQQFQQQQQQQQSLAAPNGGLIIPNWSGQQHRRLSGSQLQAMGHTAEIHQQMHRLGGSGRKLPQIPGAATDNQYPLHQVSSYGGQAQAGEQMPLGPGARHASTGQLENSGLFHQHQQQFGGYQSATNEQQIKLFPSNLGLRMQHQLDGSYPAVSSQHLSASGVSAQPMGDSQQSRSASELHANVNYHHQHQQQQAQLRNQITAAGSTLTLNASLWAQPGAMASQQAVSENMLNYGDQAKPMQQQQYYNGHMAATNGRGRHHLILQQQQQQPPMHDEICGLIGLQLNVDTRAELLEISILSAVNVNRNTSLDYCARLKILPENGRFKACTTQPSADLNWKETFIFQNFPTHQAHKMALEIGIWAHDEAPRLAAHIAQPICETLIPIQSARERNIDFWPLRPAPSSPQTRRKSLNDLFGPNYQIAQNQDLWSQAEYAHNQSVATFRQTAGSQRQQAAAAAATTTPTAKRQASQAPIRQQSQQQQQQPITTQAYGGQNTFASSTTSQRASPNDSPQRRPSYGQLMQHYAGRERSSSNRNLPTENSNKLLQVQPRRASDEVAASSSHRMVARMSPAPSRRSISVINVGGGGDRSSQSRLGSQSNIMKAHLRRDSTVGSGGGGGLQQQQQQQMVTGSASPPSKFGTPTGAGRRVSMASGCRSQKNSQSDATDHESPLGGKAHKRSRESSLATDLHASSQPPTPPTGTPIGQQSRQQTRAKQARKKGLQQQQPNSTSAIGGSTHPSCSSNSGSRRGSTESPAGQLHRRGSFAMQTLHKLKRTMSLNKGNTSQSDASNQESRRSSSSSGTSGNQLVAEDLAVSRVTEKKGELKLQTDNDDVLLAVATDITSRNIQKSCPLIELMYRPAPSDSVGRLKMSFIMTKGQFEIDVISAQGLKFDHSSATGLYVKMYLKGRSKSHKRKTRVVQPWESPVFKQTIKYDGPLIDNKLLEVRVWLRQTGFRAKQPIGFTEIRLAELSLDQLQTSWYNLRPMDSVCSSSLED